MEIKGTADLARSARGKHEILIIEETTTEYHGWIEGKDTNRSAPSFDAMMAELIAYRHEGPNSLAGVYFMKMLAPPTEDA